MHVISSFLSSIECSYYLIIIAISIAPLPARRGGQRVYQGHYRNKGICHFVKKPCLLPYFVVSPFYVKVGYSFREFYGELVLSNYHSLPASREEFKAVIRREKKKQCNIQQPKKLLLL